MRKPWDTLWQRIKCRLGLHWFYRKQQVSEASDLIGCACCGREWGMNHDVRGLIPWDEELERMYARFGTVVDHGVQPPGIKPRGYPGAAP